MKIAILDDYQDAVRTLDAFERLAGHDVLVFNDTCRDPQALADRLTGVEGLVLIRERTRIDETLLSRLPDLKIISQTGGGAAHIDKQACDRHGVQIVTGTGLPHAAAELTWALVLATARHLPQEIENLKAGRWQRTLGTGLNGRTLGVFGLGRIGSLVARYGQAFGMQVLVWGREGSQARAHDAGLEVAASQRELFERADVLSLHLRLNDDTRGIVGADDLAAMSPDSMLINTSRAELIASGALEAALRQGRPGRAGIDVFEQEPLIEHPMLALPNLVATPHLGYVEKDTYERYFGDAFDNLLAFDGKD
jgi:D-3-phosphoglycerate dehydrogenase / 2-oxoglutarate reductase